MSDLQLQATVGLPFQFSLPSYFIEIHAWMVRPNSASLVYLGATRGPMPDRERLGAEPESIFHFVADAPGDFTIEATLRPVDQNLVPNPGGAAAETKSIAVHVVPAAKDSA